jgi:hypothetical protein
MHTLTVTDSLLCPVGFQWDQGIATDCVHDPLQLDPFGTGWGNTMLFRRELLDLFPREIRPLQPGNPERRLSHDTWIYVLSAALGRVSHLVAPLILYRQHGANVSGRTVPVRTNRLLRLAKVPIIEYREHALFDKRMAELFLGLSQRRGPMADAAKDAAKCFSRRNAYWSARVETFDSPTFPGRYRAFRQSRLLAPGRRLWMGSRAKDLALGVLAFGSTSVGARLLDDPLPCAR